MTVDKKSILVAFEDSEGNLVAAAKKLRISSRTLLRRIQTFGIRAGVTAIRARHGLPGWRSTAPKLDVEQVREIRKQLALPKKRRRWATAVEMARQYGVSSGTISGIKGNRLYRA